MCLRSGMRTWDGTPVPGCGVAGVDHGGEQTQQNEESATQPAPARARSLTLDTHDIKIRAHTVRAGVSAHPGELYVLTEIGGRLVETRRSV